MSIRSRERRKTIDCRVSETLYISAVASYLRDDTVTQLLQQTAINLYITSSYPTRLLFSTGTMANVNNEMSEQVPINHQQDAQEEVPTLAESKMPTRKDTSLKEFLGKMDDYAPIVSSNHVFRLHYLASSLTLF